MFRWIINLPIQLKEMTLVKYTMDCYGWRSLSWRMHWTLFVVSFLYFFSRTLVLSMSLGINIHPGIRCDVFLSLCEFSAAFVSSFKQNGRKTKQNVLIRQPCIPLPVLKCVHLSCPHCNSITLITQQPSPTQAELNKPTIQPSPSLPFYVRSLASTPPLFIML